MYKFTCFENNCENKNITYYMPEVTEKVLCGGCKTFNTPIEMSKKEYDEIFDYDPFKKSEII